MSASKGAAQDDAGDWVFGYGSLIWKADFPFVERRRARIHGWARRFWQGSHDHRGTPQAPGRVLTLVAAAGVDCVGIAYRVAHEVYAHLDRREQNGYARVRTGFVFDDGSGAEGTVYLAQEGNEAFLGPAPEADIARHIARARGPSGSNRDYLLQLAAALRELGAEDPHVFEVERALLSLSPEPSPDGVPWREGDAGFPGVGGSGRSR